MNTVQKCGSCGAGLTLDQMRGTDCPYCRVVFPHHARAVEQAALVNQIMAQQTGGMWGAGAPQQPPVQYGVTPPPYGAPGQYAPPIYPTPYAPFNVNNVGMVVGNQVERAVARSLIGVVIAIAVVFVLATGLGVAVFLFAR